MDVSFLRHRRAVTYTVGVVAISICGAYVGAFLKSKKQVAAVEERKNSLASGQVSVDEHIALLQTTRDHLVMKRGVFDNKIAQVRKEAREREQAEKERVERRKKKLGLEP